jgi:hypothetical protein
MSDESAVLRISRNCLSDLRSQFEQLAPKFLKLRHVYIAYNEICELPIPDMNSGRTGLLHAFGPYQLGMNAFLDGQWTRIHALTARQIRVWESWYEGDGQIEFHSLAQGVAAQLEAFRIGVPPPSDLEAILRGNPMFPAGLPVLPAEQHRWTIGLHWLAWAGKVMPVRRYGLWNGMNLPFDDWDEARHGPRPTAFHSIIDNLFIRSVAALEWMIAGLDQAHSNTVNSEQSHVTHTARKRIGRPPDTDRVADRRISEAWKTGRHKSLEGLANAMGVDKRAVELAIDRERKRAAGKSSSGKTRQ